MKFIFATSTQAPWPQFMLKLAGKTGDVNVLMSYYQTRGFPDLTIFLKRDPARDIQKRKTQNEN